jgi:electron-transferring-flavoprotein dehydrogenase
MSYGVERQAMDVDIVCVGFGPATAGFLSTLAKTPNLESRAAPGLPLQVVCYERADDIGFGVSGVVTRARGIRATLPDLDPSQIPMAAPVVQEKLVYLLDPVGASRRSLPHRIADRLIRPFAGRNRAVELPYVPPFLRKEGGLVMSVGQFLQFVGGQVMASGTAQIWPGMPVAEALVEDGRMLGVRLSDQGVDREGRPESGYLPGMDVRSELTVVADGPVGAVGQQLNKTPAREWAVGMKMVIDLPEGVDLPAGTVLHTFGYPEPEIFGFLYVHPERVASAGIFVPSWFRSPARTCYRYLQHFLLHPYVWRHLQGGRLRSWGAKSLQESGRRGEPLLAGDGWARIGEGSGSTNPLTGSGVDEAWTTGAQLAEGVAELLAAGKPLSRENLETAYVARRRASWVEAEARIAERARDGFHRGLLPGLAGMALSALTKGRMAVPGEPRRMPSLKSFDPRAEALVADCRAKGVPWHDAFMDYRGWPAIPYDGRLLISHQDALLMGGKVQAPAGAADHVRFLFPILCRRCAARLCVEMCSGQAIAPGPEGASSVPSFDREKCVHCGACLWNCPDRAIAFGAGPGGLHSSEN